jgi:hypothetical protein
MLKPPAYVNPYISQLKLVVLIHQERDNKNAIGTITS